MQIFLKENIVYYSILDYVLNYFDTFCKLYQSFRLQSTYIFLLRIYEQGLGVFYSCYMDLFNSQST